MKRSTRSLLITALCAYMVYADIRTLAGTPFAEWTSASWALVVVSLGLAVAGIFSARTAWLAHKTEQDEAKASEEARQAEQEAARAAEEAAAELQATARPEEEDELAAMDDMGDLEGMEIIGVETVWVDAEPEDEDAPGEAAEDEAREPGA